MPRSANRSRAPGADSHGLTIGIDASRAVMARRTGVENYSLHLIRALAKLDTPHRLRLYLRERPLPGALPVGGRVSWRVIPFPRAWTHVRLAHEQWSRPPDALFVPAHVLPLIRPRVSVMTVHDLGYRFFPDCHPWRQRWYLELTTRYAVAAASRLIADSMATKRDLVAEYGARPDRVDVVHLAYDQVFAPAVDASAIAAARARYELPERYFLFIGSLQPRKNLARLIRAFRPVAAKDPTVALALAGKPGWLDAGVEAAIRDTGLGRRVCQLGFVPDEDLPLLLSGALALTLPSLYEGFGLPALEAMACGAPTLVANTSSLPEVVGDAGLFVDPLDESAITGALIRLNEDPVLRANLAQRGLDRASGFTWAKAAVETMTVIERAAGENRVG